MLDHIGLTVSDVGRAKAFFDAALAPLGIAPVMSVTAEESGGHAHTGYGSEGRPYFWIGGPGPATTGVHVAFTAAGRAGVDAFYAAAMAAGGRDNGPPGIRAHYHPNYYGAFVLDPDGNNIEAVCHQPAD
jgi:catechol 2,3-dioxygenase-like lactoylglutathione lyase family enzyme